MAYCISHFALPLYFFIRNKSVWVHNLLGERGAEKSMFDARHVMSRCLLSLQGASLNGKTSYNALTAGASWAKAAELHRDCTLGVTGHSVILSKEGLARRMEAGGEGVNGFQNWVCVNSFCPAAVLVSVGREERWKEAQQSLLLPPASPALLLYETSHSSRYRKESEKGQENQPQSPQEHTSLPAVWRSLFCLGSHRHGNTCWGVNLVLYCLQATTRHILG